MKKAVFGILFIFLINNGYSQQKIEWIDVDKIIENCSKYEQEGDFEKALIEINKVPKNDSIYYSLQTSKAYYLNNTEKYDEALKVTELGMEAEEHPNKYYFMLNSASAYLELEQYQNAINKYDEMLEIYPKNYQAYYGKGLAYEGLEDFETAVKMYQTSITLSPFNANSHLKLGALCYQEHHITQAMMCLSMYLLINPDGSNSFNILNVYNNMVEVKNDSEKHPDVEISVDDDSFEEIDLIINNYAALNNKYKISNKLNLPIIKQNHAMIKQLEDYEGNGGFWDKYYVPFYKFIDEEELFDVFTYTIAFSVKNEKYKSIVNKQVSDIKSFINVYKEKWQEIIGKNEEIIDGSKKQVQYLYKDLIVNGIGVYENEIPKGEWHFYNSYGGILSVGKFDDEGERNGKWIWYNKLGGLDEVGEFAHGKSTGEYLIYYKNGKLNLRAHYVNDILNGEFERYTKKGALSQHYNYKENEYDGEYLEYYSNGDNFLEYIIPYNTGTEEGTIYVYYPDGSIQSEVVMTDGKKQGIKKHYFQDGEIEITKNYKDNLLEGKFVEYYSNGNVFQEGNYIEGEKTGEWKKYYYEGALNEVLVYSKGKIEGISKEYDRDGILFCEYTYRKGNIIAYKFYNKKNKIIKEAKKQKGEFYYQGYNANGNIVTKGRYDVTGGKKGLWKYYNKNGVLESVDNMVEGKTDGTSKFYYANGAIKSITPYKDDTVTGYYSEFYPNNQLKQQGWFNNDVLEGEWISYYPDGTLKSKNYYTNNKLYGLSYNYSPDGKIVNHIHYQDGRLLTEYQYNHEGEVFDVIDADVDSAKYLMITKFSNGDISTVCEMLYGKRHGSYIGYNFDGKPIVEGRYYYDEQDSIWNWYYPNGDIEQTGVYKFGERDGIWNDYHENGKLRKEREYINGNINGAEKNYNEESVLSQTRSFINGLTHGETSFFSDEGELQMIRYYIYDQLVGYSYLDTNSEILPMIPLKNETGIITAYYNNGKISRQMELIKGDFNNEYIEYYYNGQVCEKQTFSYGNNEGADIYYYSDGTIKEERNYNTGIINGIVNEYYPNGKLKKQTPFMYGDIVGTVKEFNNEGDLIKETNYFNDDPYSQKIY